MKKKIYSLLLLIFVLLGCELPTKKIKLQDVNTATVSDGKAGLKTEEKGEDPLRARRDVSLTAQTSTEPKQKVEEKPKAEDIPKQDIKDPQPQPSQAKNQVPVSTATPSIPKNIMVAQDIRIGRRIHSGVTGKNQDTYLEIFEIEEPVKEDEKESSNEDNPKKEGDTDSEEEAEWCENLENECCPENVEGCCFDNDCEEGSGDGAIEDYEDDGNSMVSLTPAPQPELELEKIPYRPTYRKAERSEDGLSGSMTGVLTETEDTLGYSPYRRKSTVCKDEANCVHIEYETQPRYKVTAKDSRDGKK